MGTIAPQAPGSPTPTPVGLANIETTHWVTVGRRVFFVHPDITATNWELTRL